MKTIKFDPNGGKLKVKYTFIGLIAGSYSNTLWDKPIKHRLQYNESECIPKTATVDLLESLSQNNGTLVELFVSFKGTDTKNFSDYEIKADIYQNDKLIDGDKDSGKVTGSFQDSTIQIKLLSN